MSTTMLIAILVRFLPAWYLVPPANDECAGAMEIAGEGEFSFSNTEATTSDIITECADFPMFADPNFQADVWYCWTAGCSGVVTVDTCGSSAADTKIGIYEGCECSTGAFLTCSDDACATQSIVEFSAKAGAAYGIRIGSAPGFSGATDSMHIACRAYYKSDYGSHTVPQCNYQNSPATYTAVCKSRSGWDALSSTRGEYTIAEDFVPEKGGSISTVCWAGAYLNDGQECIRHSLDEFEITYYADDCGSPGAIIAGPFPSHNQSLAVAGPAMTQVEFLIGAQEFEYGAQHEPVEVTAGQTYWVGITNSAEGDCSWYWETSPGNLGYAVQIDESNNSTAVVQNDLSLCFDLRHENAGFCPSATAPNDTCDTAIPLDTGTVEFDTLGATTEGSIFSEPQDATAGFSPIPYYDDFPLGDDKLHKDIWFDLPNPCSGKARFSVCDSSFDTKLAVLRGYDCPFYTIMARSDDDCGFENLQSFVELPVLDLFHYKVNVSGYDGSWGKGRLQFQYVTPDHPTLLHFAALSRCFTGTCTPPCGPLVQQDCCNAQDFDADSDVDLLDAHDLLKALTGPE